MGLPVAESTRGPNQRGPLARYTSRLRPANTGAIHQYLRTRERTGIFLVFFFML